MLKISKENKSRIIFTCLMLVVYCIGISIPIAGIDKTALSQLFSNNNSGLFDLFNLFTGGSFQNFTLFALGITPYITASIIIQLLTISFSYFENLSKEGEIGRKKLASITRYSAIFFALIQALGMTLGLFKSAIIDKNAFTFFVIIITLTTGTVILMWLGEQINEFGIGNGISILIFAGIVIRLPVQIKELISAATNGSISWVTLIIISIFSILLISGIIYIQGGTRKIPVQYAKRVVGRKIYGGQSTHIPIKLNGAGVIPIIFSLSILQFPITITYFTPNSKYSEIITKYFSPSGNIGVWVYMLINILLIIGFTYFYTFIMFKPDNISNELKQNGGNIPSIRPGKPTEEYLTNILKRLCLVDGIFLSFIATLPILISAFTSLNLTFGGTSLLILIGVAMDTVNKINEREIMNKYKGFLN